MIEVLGGPVGGNQSSLAALRMTTKEIEMPNKMVLAALATFMVAPAFVAAPAIAQDRHYDRNDREYRDRDRNYRRKCGGGNGAVGTVAGGAGGALIGNQLGGGTLGTVAGGVGGALLGRHFDKKNTRAKNGC